MVPRAGIFPAELTALRSAGILIAIFMVAYAVVRRRDLRNADVLILVLGGLGLALVAGTEIVNGLLSAFDSQTGKPHYQVQRLEKAPNVFASPVAAAGRVYVVGRDGTTVVLKHGPAPEVLAENTLDDGFDASPAIVDREIYLRGYRFLYGIAAQ